MQYLCTVLFTFILRIKGLINVVFFRLRCETRAVLLCA